MQLISRRIVSIDRKFYNNFVFSYCRASIAGAILAGWFYGQPMDLDFSTFDAVVQMLTVFLVSQVLSHGETNWLHFWPRLFVLSSMVINKYNTEINQPMGNIDIT